MWPVAGVGGGSDWRAAPPPSLPHPPLTAWLQHTAVTRIHLCHHPTVGLMSSPVKPLEHSTRAGPTPGPEAQGLPQRVPCLPASPHQVSGRLSPEACGSRCWPEPCPENTGWTALPRAGSGPFLVPPEPSLAHGYPSGIGPSPGPGDSTG